MEFLKSIACLILLFLLGFSYSGATKVLDIRLYYFGTLSVLRIIAKRTFQNPASGGDNKKTDAVQYTNNAVRIGGK